MTERDTKMNNEEKFKEIAKFCMKQKADENMAEEYRELGKKEAMRVARYCNLLRWVLNPYADSLVSCTFDMQNAEEASAAEANIKKQIKFGFKTKLAFVGDYNYGRDVYGVVLTFQKEDEKTSPNNGIVLVVPYGKLLQFSETLNKWFKK